MRILSLLFIFSGCAYDPQIIRRANIRQHASDKLEACLGWRSLAHQKGYESTKENKKACIEENKRFCTEQGLEAACGIDGLWTRNY